MNMKKNLLGAMLLSSTMMLAACTSGSTVLTSDAGSITQEELYTALKAQSGSQVLQRLVLVKVLEKNVDDKAALKEEAEKEVATQMTQYGGEESLAQVLSQSGFGSVDQYKETVYLNKLITAAVKKAAEFTEEEIQAYYDSWEPKITAQHILIEANDQADEETRAAAESKAKELIKQLEGGADFAELAKANSADKGSAENGGTVGPFKRSDMVKEFSDAAFALENNGDITKEPVKTQYGYHIIKLTDKPAKGTLEELRSTIEEEMIQGKLADSAYIHEVISKLIQEANISIKDEALKDALKEFLPSEEKPAEEASSSSN